jgi:hypothetical protein
MKQTTCMEPRTNMNRVSRRFWIAVALSSLVMGNSSDLFAQALDTPQTRMQPIGAPSRVDRYRSDTNRLVETEYRGAAPQAQAITTSFNRPYNQPASYNQGTFVDPNVRQTVLLQQGGFSFPGQVPQTQTPSGQPSTGPALTPGFVGPPLTNVPSGGSIGLPNSPATGAFQGQPPVALPAPGPAANTFAPAPRSSVAPNAPLSSTLDFQPIPQPQLGNAYATIDNCSCISPPSGYSAASIGCGSPVNYAAPGYVAPTGYVAPPSQIAAPFAAPVQFPSVTGNAAPLPSLFTLGQQNNPVQVGQGIIGQPVAYVPGQPIRNFIRYLFP